MSWNSTCIGQFVCPSSGVLFIYLFIKHAPLLWSNITCYKFTCWFHLQGMPWPASWRQSLRSLYSFKQYINIMVCRQLSSMSICSCSKAVYKPVWHIPLLSVQWINYRRWTDELSETCRVSWQNKFVTLVHLVGFITKKFVLYFLRKC